MRPPPGSHLSPYRKSTSCGARVAITTATGRTTDTNRGTERRRPNSTASVFCSASREKLGTET